MNRLLAEHHGPSNYQRIPARDRGDLGLEGFSLDGTVYQCYVADNPLTVGSLHESQQNKIRTDLRKLCENQTRLLKLLGAGFVRRWILVVPRYESVRTVEYCRKRAAEVRALQLPHIAEDFEILVHSDDDFSSARQRLYAVGISGLPMSPVPIDGTAVDIWVGANSELVGILKTKLEGVVRPNLLDSKVRDLLGAYVAGNDDLDRLLKDYPDVYRAVARARNAREQRLVLATLGISRPEKVLVDELDSLREDLKQHVGAGSDDVATRIALHTLSEWLMRCPLSFS